MILEMCSYIYVVQVCEQGNRHTANIDWYVFVVVEARRVVVREPKKKGQGGHKNTTAGGMLAHVSVKIIKHKSDPKKATMDQRKRACGKPNLIARG